jgi:hypothetical protein
MDHEIDKQEPSSKEGGQVKVGDKVWVLCEVIDRKRNEAFARVEVGSRQGRAWVDVSDCRPVEPSPKEPTETQKLAERTMKAIWAANDAVNGTPAIKESLTTEPSLSEIPNSSSDPLAVGDAVRFVWPGHKRHRTEGTIISTMGDPSIFVDIKEYPYRFKSDCGAFERWCSVGQLERIDKADPINPSHYKQGGIECIEAIKAALGEGFPDYLRGNVIKYLWRYKEKGGVEDLRKSAWYLDRLIKEVGE